MLGCVTLAMASASAWRRLKGNVVERPVFGPHDLDGDFAFERNLLGKINVAHAALAQQTQKLELAQGPPAQIHGGRRRRFIFCGKERGSLIHTEAITGRVIER